MNQQLLKLGKAYKRKGNWAALYRLSLLTGEDRLFGMALRASLRDKAYGRRELKEMDRWIWERATQGEGDAASNLSIWEEATLDIRYTLELFNLQYGPLRAMSEAGFNSDIEISSIQSAMDSLQKHSSNMSEIFDFAFAGRLLIDVAMSLLALGKNEQAAETFYKACGEFSKEENQFLVEDFELEARLQLSHCFETQDEDDLAVTELQKALVLAESQASNGDFEARVTLGRVLSNLGNALGNLGRFPEAETSFERAIQLRKQLASVSPNTQTACVARSQTRYGEMLVHANRLSDAKPEHKSAVDGFRTVLDHQWEDVSEELGSALCSLGATLGELGEFQDAERALTESIQCLENEASFELVKSYKTLAILKERLQDSAAAADLLSSAIELCEASLERDPLLSSIH